MACLNKVQLLGCLGADPDIRATKDGREIVNLRLATSDTWKDKSTGEKREKTEWHSVVIFSEGLCRVAAQYLKKGSKVYVEGALQTRKWQDKDGNDRYTTEIVLQGFGAQLILLDGKPQSGGGDYASASQSSARRAPPPTVSTSYADDFDDEIPF